LEIIKQVENKTSLWGADNRTCTLPTSLNLDINYAKAGYLYNPQNYIVSSKFYTKNEYNY